MGALPEWNDPFCEPWRASTDRPRLGQALLHEGHHRVILGRMKEALQLQSLEIRAAAIAIALGGLQQHVAAGQLTPKAAVCA